MERHDPGGLSLKAGTAQGLRGKPTAAFTVAACLVVGLAACTPPEPPTEDVSAPGKQAEPLEITRPLPERSPTMPTDGESVLPPEKLLTPVLADASERGGVAAEELVVTGAWRRTWSDGSMGCPLPGMHYTQALVTGWRVVVQAGEQTLDYRLSDRGYFVLCPGGIEIGVLPTVER
jgi:hypothetical protein